MRIVFISYGKLKNPGFRDTADHYLKMISPWAKIEEIELKPLEVPDKSPATRMQIQEKEAALFLDRMNGLGIRPKQSLYLLDETGKSQPTLGWAKLFSEGDLALAIGSSLGWSALLKTQCKGLLSLGPQTLSHELAKTVLLEQVYRALSVIQGHPYHNEK